MLLLVVVVVLTACSAANVLRFEQNDDVVCPGDGASCSGASSTCCGSQSGGWSCCPFKNGQCCADGAHCCPSGSVCSIETSSCRPLATNNVTSAIVESWPAVRRASQPESGTDEPSPLKAGLTCPNKKTRCELPGSACCRDAIGRFACCRYPYNVCCNDGVHCCRSGTVCDGLTNLCLRYPSTDNFSWSNTISATVRATDTNRIVSDGSAQEVLAVAAVDVPDVVVDNKDEQTNVESAQSVAMVNGYCPDGTVCFGTCCLQSVFPPRYGCCTFTLASCCIGGRQCCRFGYRCVGSSCIRN